MACIVVLPVYGIYWAVDHFQFKRHVMNALDENPNTISNYLQARNVLESDDYLGRPLKGGEKKRLSKYLRAAITTVEEKLEIMPEQPSLRVRSMQAHSIVPAQAPLIITLPSTTRTQKLAMTTTATATSTQHSCEAAARLKVAIALQSAYRGQVVRRGLAAQKIQRSWKLYCFRKGRWIAAFRFYFNEASCEAKSTSRRSDRSAKRRRATKMLGKMPSFQRIRNLFNEHQIELATIYPEAVDHSIVPLQTNPMFKLKKLATHANIECLVEQQSNKQTTG